MCSPAYFLKKRITWEFFPATAMGGIWGRLVKQKLCLYSDRQWSSADQLGKSKLQINKGALKGRENCQSWGEVDGVINHSTHSLSHFLSRSYWIDFQYYSRLTLSLSTSQSKKIPALFSNNIARILKHLIVTSYQLLMKYSDFIFIFGYTLSCPCYSVQVLSNIQHVFI